MIKVSVMYANSADVKFDIDYYCQTHMPLVAELLGDALKESAVDYGMAGGAPGEAPAFVAMGHMTYESVGTFQKAFGPHAKQIMADLPNFTDAQPVIQISEIKM
ncbi:EthD family reductase [Amphritea japonica]|uniref:Ethyl tert-butyl ether degradation EthD n=1 Tax=Amphritea japonica ATCC BAA-1530 TaxID=1278309 RepID=A0A7R6P1S3_9GAMM|nr:EthD family reductase [Amphritea japonica]BBB25324.1 ethyl tert-butyl ether degradation EthD [Amphritea japonica ATCC BAA-1530]